MVNYALILILCLIFLKERALGIAEYEQIVNINDRHVKLPCRINDQVQEINVQWTRNGDIITRGTYVERDKKRLSINKSGGTNEWNLHINNLFPSDAALYVCKLGDKEYSKIRLIIKTQPKIDQEQSSKRDQSVKEDDTLTLMCTASGKPKPEIKWYRQSLHPYVENGARKDMGITGSTLVIYNITRYGGDLYICEAVNDQDSDDFEVNVTVKFNPEVTLFETEIVTRKHVDVIMSCMVQAVPLYNAYWRSPNGDKIRDNSYKYEVTVEDLQGYPARLLTLVLRSTGWTADRDAGNYTCQAEGEGVEDFGRVLVTVKTDAIDDTSDKYDVPGQN